MTLTTYRWSLESIFINCRLIEKYPFIDRWLVVERKKLFTRIQLQGACSSWRSIHAETTRGAIPFAKRIAAPRHRLSPDITGTRRR